MPPVTNETKIALLEQRMDLVEARVETVAEERPTTREVEMLIAKSVPSREENKADMAGVLIQYLSGDTQSKRNTRVEIIKALSYTLGSGGIVTLIALLIGKGP